MVRPTDERRTMPEEARLEETGAGLAPVTRGWFVVNVRDTAWETTGDYGARCRLENRDAVPFEQVGVNIRVLQPGQPNCKYHAESPEEHFLVLAGECLLLVEEEERLLRAWDFVHCPPHTRHVFVGAGDGPCAILMVGDRPPPEEDRVVYPVSELALRHGAGVETETDSPAVAYAGREAERREHPPGWDAMPWA
jgi:uncharacterized cupin superfamily protein